MLHRDTTASRQTGSSFDFLFWEPFVPFLLMSGYYANAKKKASEIQTTGRKIEKMLFDTIAESPDV